MAATSAAERKDMAALSDSARMALERAGEQWTPLRASLYQLLRAQTQPASAYDIAEALSARVKRRIAPNTVYRLLDLLVATNLATRIESRNAYLASSHPEHVHDCIFVVCERCGTTQHIDDDKLSGAVRLLAGNAGFTRLQPVIEVKGLCPACT